MNYELTLKFNFKIQQYQTDAVDAVVRVFNGQPRRDRVLYIRDLGRYGSGRTEGLQKG